MDLQCHNHYQLMALNGWKIEWMEDLSKIDEDFIKNYDENSDKGYILEADAISIYLNILETYVICIVIYHYCQKE